MFELIAFRALQGLGGGGLMVGAQTIVGDVVSPRERGRYMGLFGAMFGVTTVIGPLIGGLFVEYLSLALDLLHQRPHRRPSRSSSPRSPSRARSTEVHRVIDYLGTVLLALSATALVLFTSLGGTSYSWGSPFMVGAGRRRRGPGRPLRPGRAAGGRAGDPAAAVRATGCSRRPAPSASSSGSPCSAR